MNFSVAAAGLKGLEFVRGLIQRGHVPLALASYEQPDDHAHAFGRLRGIAQEHSIPFVETRHPAFGVGDIFFFVGWQFKLEQPDARVCVFHDSLLPRYRGFAPTASASINGDHELGVTALRPIADVDAGPILAQARQTIAYPMRIGDALGLQSGLMLDLAARILSAGTTSEVAQDHSLATFSVWRDEMDYFVDWSMDAAAIARHVDAVGFPYAGAKAVLSGEPCVLALVEVVPDVTFERRDIGKIWQLDDGFPTIICGQGMLRITDARTADGSVFVFDRLRKRFVVTPEVAMTQYSAVANQSRH